MKVGDLVISIWLNPSPIGIVIEISKAEYLDSQSQLIVHVGWVGGNYSWLEPEDLEIISESR